MFGVSKVLYLGVTEEETAMERSTNDEYSQRTCSSTIEPEIDPIAQHRVFKLFQLQSSPFSCLLNFFNICSQTNEDLYQFKKNILKSIKTFLMF